MIFTILAKIFSHFGWNIFTSWSYNVSQLDEGDTIDLVALIAGVSVVVEPDQALRVTGADHLSHDHKARCDDITNTVTQ